MEPDCTCDPVCYSTHTHTHTHLSTMRSRVRLRRHSVRPLSPSSTSCWQEGHGNNMGGGAASFRLRPGYVPHTGRRTQVSPRRRRKKRRVEMERRKRCVCWMEDLVWEERQIIQETRRKCEKQSCCLSLVSMQTTGINKGQVTAEKNLFAYTHALKHTCSTDPCCSLPLWPLLYMQLNKSWD